MKNNASFEIFISYRRLDELGNISGRDQARLIAKQLQLEGFNAFFDYSEIRDNEFDKIIIPAVENCKVFILVLTKDSLNRCSNSDDWVRREIETAIKSNCKIVSVTPDNAFTGWPQNLPESLKKIKTIQISDINFGQLFELSISKLIQDRIYPIIPKSKSSNGITDLSKQFHLIINNLFKLNIQYTDSINNGAVVNNEQFVEIRGLIKDLYIISEMAKFHDPAIYEKSVAIVNYYNSFINALRKQFSSPAEEACLFEQNAIESSNRFRDFKNAILKELFI